MTTRDLKGQTADLAASLEASIQRLEEGIRKLANQRDAQLRVLNSLRTILPGAVPVTSREGISLEEAIDHVMPPSASGGATVREIFDLIGAHSPPVTLNKVTIFNVKNIIQRKHPVRRWVRVSGSSPTRWRREE